MRTSFLQNDCDYWRIRSQYERLAKAHEETGAVVAVEYSCRDKDYNPVYMVVAHYPDDSAVCGDMLTRYKTDEWKCEISGYRFMPSFVHSYISALYGCYGKATTTQIATELAITHASVYRQLYIGSYALHLHPCGIEIDKFDSSKGIFKKALNFVPYEDFDRDEIKDVYAMVLRYYTTDEEIDGEKIPDSLIYKVFELGYPEGLKELEEINKRENR